MRASSLMAAKTKRMCVLSGQVRPVSAWHWNCKTLPCRVCLLDSGSFAPDQDAQRLNEAEIIGLPYFPLHENRWRGVGGTTRLWAGWCRPLDDFDFQHRDWVPESGWPIHREELTAYYKRAHEVCQLLPYDYDTERWSKRLQAAALPLAEKDIETRIYHLGPPTRFGSTYRARLIAANNLQVWTHATVMELVTSHDGSSIKRVKVGCLNGVRFTIRARVFVLATGAIEAARLLLLSRDRWTNGIGNDTDLVGRYFMEHIHFDAGTITLSPAWRTAASLYTDSTRPAVGRLFPADATQRQHRILNCNIGLTSTPGQTLPIAVRLGRRLRSKRFASRRTKRWLTEAMAVVGDLGGRMEATVGLTAWPTRFDLHYTLEQAPNPHSRVTLSAETDALGMRCAQLDWRLTTLEQRTFVQTRALLRAAISAGSIGEWYAESQPQTWPPSPLQGLRGHHMGTTRMHPDPRFGVVDTDCRVHGVQNLYISSSSVFPTSGSGTPTLTIVALAVRLAGLIKRGWL